jgi:hypothetical protein
VIVVRPSKFVPVDSGLTEREVKDIHDMLAGMESTDR